MEPEIISEVQLVKDENECHSIQVLEGTDNLTMMLIAGMLIECVAVDYELPSHEIAAIIVSTLKDKRESDKDKLNK